jgi:hypothetical protein|tara:strand:- start:9093 stop:9353 length:261 start_codon:yes stop_codon:yes gene_type:complete
LDRKPTAAEEILADVASVSCVLILVAAASAGLHAFLHPLDSRLAGLSIVLLWGGLFANKIAVAPRPSVIELCAKPIKALFLKGKTS